MHNGKCQYHVACGIQLTSTHRNAKITKQLSKIYGPIKTWRGQKNIKKEQEILAQKVGSYQLSYTLFITETILLWRALCMLC